MAKIKGLLSMAHLVCYKTFYKVVYINLKAWRQKQWPTCFLCTQANKYSSLGGSWLPLSIFQCFKEKKKKKKVKIKYFVGKSQTNKDHKKNIWQVSGKLFKEGRIVEAPEVWNGSKNRNDHRRKISQNQLLKRRQHSLTLLWSSGNRLLPSQWFPPVQSFQDFE